MSCTSKVKLPLLNGTRPEVRRKDEQRDLGRMREEACQVAAMAIRFMTDICGEGTK